MSEPASRTARRRPPRRPLWRRPFVQLAALAAALVFALLLGISIGRALEDGPAPGGTQTNVRTLDPRPLPAVTVTVTG